MIPITPTKDLVIFQEATKENYVWWWHYMV